MRTVVVFLGPSLPRAEAESMLSAVFLPPAAGGDVLRAWVRHRPAAIGLVDGLFEQVPSVRHKEILYVLTQGVQVYGAASMGALRAAELAEFGMVGVGDVFRAFRDGAYENDDEVAVSHASAEFGWRPTSEALVNLRWGLALARERAVIGRRTQELVLQAARETFYPYRSWANAAQGGRKHGADATEVAAMLDFVRRERPNRKAEDARALLRRMAADAAAPAPAPGPGFVFQATEDFLGWLRAAKADRPDGHASVSSPG